MRKLLLLLVSVLPLSAENVRYTVTGLLGGTLDFIAPTFLRNLPPTQDDDLRTYWDMPNAGLISSPCRQPFGRPCTSLRFVLDYTGDPSAYVRWTYYDDIDRIERTGDSMRFFGIDFTQLGQFAEGGGEWHGRGLTVSLTDQPATYAPEPRTLLLTLPAFAGLWLWRKSRNGWSDAPVVAMMETSYPSARY